MGIAWFRFYEELNDFLPESARKISFPRTFAGNQSVKDTIESIGVPHVEIDMILVNGQPVDFTCKLKDGDEISVYPVFESLDITGITRLREKPLRDPKFILDVHLGKLSKYLRLLGFDTFYDRTYSDDVIINISVSEGRIILTHDRGLLKNKKVTRGYWIRSMDPEEQVSEITGRFNLKNNFNPFTRCLECNELLVNIEKAEIIEDLQTNTKKYYHDFRKCPGCGRIYWEGSHYEHMKKFVDKITNPQNKSYI